MLYIRTENNKLCDLIAEVADCVSGEIFKSARINNLIAC